MSDARWRVEAVVAGYRPLSHADMIVGRLLQGYGANRVPIRPHVDVASMGTDQVPANDLRRRPAAPLSAGEGARRCASRESRPSGSRRSRT